MAFKLNIGMVEDFVAGHVRLFIVAVFAGVVLVGVVALTVFFVAIRGAEQVMAPDVRNKDLLEALTELQAKELYPRIQTRYSQAAEDRGMVLEQDPKPGTIVKAGRRIRLVVSQGVMINTIENYQGRNIEEVRMDLRAFFAAASLPFLSIKEPVLYEFSSEPAGSILEQKPPPGEPVSGPVILEFVVSKGPEYAMITVPDLIGLSPAAALEALRGTGLGFTFSLRPARAAEKAGVAVFQEPAKDTVIESKGKVHILVAKPEDSGGEVFGLFSYTMPENPYPLTVRLEALPAALPGAASLGSGERRLLTEIEFPGGTFTFPYREVP
jgi:beta-lactam-binding protein with PASTA domain